MSTVTKCNPNLTKVQLRSNKLASLGATLVGNSDDLLLVSIHNERMMVCSEVWWSTGWSKETVNYDFSLTDLKDTKYGITQYFLESLYSLVLIFGCLKWVRQNKSCLSVLCQNGGFGSSLTWSRRNWAYKYTLRHPWLAQTSHTITQIHQNTPPDTSRQHQTPTDTNRHHQTSSNIHDNPQTILEHSWGTSKTLLNIPWSPQSLKDCLRDVHGQSKMAGCLRGGSWVSRGVKVCKGGSRWVWGVSESVWACLRMSVVVCRCLLVSDTPLGM